MNDTIQKQNSSNRNVQSTINAPQKRNILLITTGGTIASMATGNGLAPGISSTSLMEFVPEIQDFCNFQTMDLMNLDSTNVGPDQWRQIVDSVEERYSDFDGFVITHGTDTLSYTAAALSYMIQNSTKPIMLTGSQKSIYLRDTDARRNLIDAFLYAADPDSSGVKIVFNSKVIRGTRARKIRTQSYNAFDSIDYPDVARVMGDHVTHYIVDSVHGSPVFSYSMNHPVFVLKLTPGIGADVIRILGNEYKILIIEGFGTGGLPNLETGDRISISSAVSDFTDKGGLVVMTTQVPHEGSKLATYAVGSSLTRNPGIIEGGNMTLESIVCKMLWILGKTRDRDEVKKLFLKPVDYDRL